MKNGVRIMIVVLCIVICFVSVLLMVRSCGSDQMNIPTPSNTTAPITTDESESTDGTTVVPNETTLPSATLPSGTEPTEMELERISVLSAPDKVVYKVGESFDSSGLVLLGTYSDGADRMVQTGFECQPVVFSEAGEYSVIVTYQGYSVSVSVEVVTAELEHITVRTLPERVTYFVGESLDISGLTLTAKDNNGDEQIITSGFVCTPMTFHTVGSITITVQYDGKVTAFDVQVREPVVSSVEVLTLPRKTAYQEGDQLDPAGLSLNITYSNGANKTITDGVILSPMWLTLPGNQLITVYYEGISTTFSVQVNQTALASGNCGANLYWTLTEGKTLVISGSGSMDDYSGGKGAPWSSYGAVIQKVVISDGVSHISDGAFADCSGVTGVTVSSDNGYYMNDKFGALYTKDQRSLLLFPRCIAECVVLPDGLRRIEAFAMKDCLLSELIIPDSVEYIGANAVKNGLNLSSVAIGSGIREIDVGAFAECPVLEALLVKSTQCIIADQQDTLGNADVTILYGASGSTAQRYAEKFGYIFLPM